jgi:hypothetical protein
LTECAWYTFNYTELYQIRGTSYRPAAVRARLVERESLTPLQWSIADLLDRNALEVFRKLTG